MRLSHIMPFKPGYNPIVEPNKEHQELQMGFGMLVLKKGQVYEDKTRLERAFLLIRGTASLEFDGRKEYVNRGLWRDENPWCLSVDAHTSIRITGVADHTELSILSTRNSSEFAPVLHTPENGRAVEYGANEAPDAADYTIRMIIDDEIQPASQFLLNEEILKPGRWAEHLSRNPQQPGLRYFAYYPDNGFGLVAVGKDAYYSDNNTVVKIPEDTWHASVCAPGYTQYSIWAKRRPSV